jgi:hypothetical protein
VLPKGENMHVSFNSLSNGTSEYTTDDSGIQQGLERHYQFGKLFYLAGSNESKEPVDDEEVESTTYAYDIDKMESVEVSDIASAKDYLASKFNISRTKINAKNVDKLAAEHGVLFVYPE